MIHFSDIKDWYGDLEKQKNNAHQTPQPSSESVSTSKSLTP